MPTLSHTAGPFLAGTLTGSLVATPAASAQPMPRLHDQTTNRLTAPQDVAAFSIGSLASRTEHMAGQPSSATAAYARPNCKRKAAAHGVRSYWRKRLEHGDGPLQAVLRCGKPGKRGWGYRHFSKRWSNTLERKMDDTLAKPSFIDRRITDWYFAVGTASTIGSTTSRSSTRSRTSRGQAPGTWASRPPPGTRRAAHATRPANGLAAAPATPARRPCPAPEVAANIPAAHGDLGCWTCRRARSVVVRARRSSSAIKMVVCRYSLASSRR